MKPIMVMQETDEELPENVRLLYDRMQNAMIPLIQRHLVSISAYYGGELRQHATGTLVRFSDYHYLVTAAHAIEDYHLGKESISDLQLFIDNGHGNDLVPLYGSYQATETVRDRERPHIRLEGERNDLWDIGLWELDRRTVEALTAKSFLNRRDILVTEDLTSGIYFLAGCPSVWATADTATRSATWKWMRYITHPYPEPQQLSYFDERFHMALCLGDAPDLPAKLNGISGCSIWKLSDVPANEKWDVTMAKVVAVQTCVYTQKPAAIIGTKWRYVLPVLTAMHAEIREGFRLWLPGRE